MSITNRISISFAMPEYEYARDFLVGQAKNNKSPFSFVLDFGQNNFLLLQAVVMVVKSALKNYQSLQHITNGD